MLEMLGRASSSPIIPMAGFPEPYVATKALGIPATPRSTSKPFSSRMSAMSFPDFISWRPSSAHSQIFWWTSMMSPLFSSIQSRVIFFWLLDISITSNSSQELYQIDD